MAASRAVLGLIALLAALITLYLTVIAAGGAGKHAAASRQPSPATYSNAIGGAQNAVQQANAAAQRAAGTAVGNTP
jgi:hypothetical protein